MAEHVPWRQALWTAVDAPLDWWFYPLYLLLMTGVNLWERGPSRASLWGGILLSVVALMVFCTVRRLIVGHWR